ncbi:MAG: heavy metal translocating P-type ATPase metal-binding domain-containing protein [Myxococcota bacterium]
MVQVRPTEAPAAHCPHCGVPVDGAVDRFCCAGCETAAAIISGAGLDAWYDERDRPAPRPSAPRNDYRALPVEPVADGLSCRLSIDGLRCASCVWLVEGVLQRTEGVHRATVSYASGRAQIVFDPDLVSIETLGGRIAGLGYVPRPIDGPSTADREWTVRLGVAAFCAANVMLLSASIYTGWFEGMAERYQALFRWSQLALATPVALYAASGFFTSAWRALRRGVLHMDLPISLAVAVLYGHGVVATLHHADGYLDTLVMLVTLLLVGRLLEARGRRSASAAAASIAATLPTVARRWTATHVETVAVEDLQLGDLIEVGVGEEVAADGTVESGHAEVRQALLTGESEPVARGPGDRVVAGADVVDGALRVRVERTGADTLGRRMAQDVMASVDRGLPVTPADRLAPWFTALTLVVAVATGVGTGWVWGLDTALERTVAVLVVACPCALGLSWPIAVTHGLSALARRGLILRDGASLLRLADVDHVALDKTGTLSEGAPQVVEADDRTLRIAAGLECASHHPMAVAIRNAAVERGLRLPRAEDIRETVGVGVTGRIDGQSFALRSGGPGAVVLEREGHIEGRIRVADQRRTDAARVIQQLGAGKDLTLLTGDHVEVARRMTQDLSNIEVRAGLSPTEKAVFIADQQAAGHVVLFVGDGLNDGPALVQADVGLAMRGGAAASVLAADGVVVDDALAPVRWALLAGRVVRRVVHGNLVRSVLYNVVAVGFAAAGVIDPLVAALLMPLSSLLVIAGGASVEGKLRRAASKEDAWTSL